MSGAAEQTTPYETIGGAEGVRRLADAFYDVMERNPAYAALREMHDPDLDPMRESLAGFFSVWLGGPRGWLDRRGGFCIMSRHAKMPMTQRTATQWMEAMREAMRETGVPSDLAEKMDDALSQLARAMATGRPAV